MADKARGPDNTPGSGEGQDGDAHDTDDTSKGTSDTSATDDGAVTGPTRDPGPGAAGAADAAGKDMAQQGSLDVVRAEFDLRRAEQERRGDAFDTRAGLIIGFVGVLIGLSADEPTLLQIAAQVVAVGAALAAGWSLVPRIGSGIGPRAMYVKYANRPPAETRKALLETRIWLYEQDEKRLGWKVDRLRWAGVLLVGSVFLMLVHGIIEFASSPDETPPDRRPICTEGTTHHDFPHCPRGPGTDPRSPRH